MLVFLLLLVTFTPGQSEVTGHAEVTTDHQQITTQQPMSEDVKLTTLNVQGLVRLRYATIEVHGEMENQGDMPGEATFLVHLPETAFVSKATLEVDGRVMNGEVRERKKAEQEYQQAVHDGLSAGHVTSVRDSSHVRVSVNVAARATASFNLTYEELLVRRKGRYELVINLTPGQIPDYTSVDVRIQEASNITFVKVPPFDSALTTNGNDDDRVNPDVNVTWPSEEGENIAWVQYEAKGTKVALPGPLIVRYDVDHSAQAGEVLLMDGYFVHFLAARPEREAEPLPKHAIFVLDSSGSMWGRKLDQLKDAMKHILGQLRRQDVFSIVTFSTSAAEWSIQGLEPAAGRGIYSATKRNIALAQEFINRMEASGATNIQSALRRALVLASRYRNITLAPGVSEGANFTTSKPPVTSEKLLAQPVLMFLTDGMPTAGELRLNRILNVIKFYNQLAKASIFALAFGEGANLLFLRKLSLQNSGFSRRIYEAADSTQQLQSFYQEVSSPLLTNITFAYVDTKVNLSSVTTRHFPTLFAGSEIVVAGRLIQDTKQENSWNEIPSPTFPIMGFVSAQAASNVLDDVYMPSAFQERAKFQEKEKKRKVGHLERAWAYLTVRQLLDAAALEQIPDEPQNQTFAPTPVPDSIKKLGPRERAIELALKYGFVTPVTSLVMVDRFNASSEGGLKEAQIKVDTALEMQSVDIEGMSVQDKVIPTPLRPMPGRPKPVTAAFIPAPQPPHNTTLIDSKWLDSMPWLTSLLQPDDELILPQENDNITRVVLRNPSLLQQGEGKLCQLPDTPEEGSCQHLALCSSSHAQLTDLETLLKSFCDIEEKYVGVCCATSA